MTTENYRLPENAEASIVGCVLLFPICRREVSKLISEADFSSPFYGALFSAAMELEEPDAVMFREKVKARGYDLPDGFFTALGDVAVDEHNVELYANLLHEDAQRRQLVELGQALKEGALALEDPAEMLSSAVDRLREIERGAGPGDLADPKAAWQAFFDHRGRVESGRGAVPTGFAPLDKILGGGMLRSGLYILSARPGMGKTTAALQFMDYIAQHTGPVLFVSLEMALEQIEAKRIARLSNIPSNQILLSDGKDLDYEKITDAAKSLLKLPVSISRRSTATVAQIRRMAKQIDGLQCITIDYLGKISPADRRSSRYEATTQISGDLKTLAVELGCRYCAWHSSTGRTPAGTKSGPN